MSEADLDDLVPQGAKSFVVCTQFIGEIIGSDDESWVPPKGSYSVVEDLGKGLSNQEFNKNIVAIDQDFRKVFVKELKSQALKDPQWIIQVDKQFEIHKTLNHPNIVQVKDQNYEEKKIILEFLNEANYLEKRVIEQAQPIDNIIKLKSYIVDIASGLEYLHQKSEIINNFLDLVHTDIRIETLHCRRGKQDLIRTVKIGDFGNIQRQGDVLTQFHVDFIKKRQTICPPELKAGLEVQPSFDIWCFGIVVHLMAVAYAPNSIPQNLKIVDKVSYLKQHWSQYDPELFQLVRSMLQVDPTKRPTIKQIIENHWLQ